MKITSQSNNISFQKKLVAQTMLKKKKKYIPVDIYQLEYPEDLKYYETAVFSDRNWRNCIYPAPMAYHFKNLFTPGFNTNTKKFYTLEHNGKSLGLVQTGDNKTNKTKNIDYLEVCPTYSADKNEKRDIKYIGQTIIAFLAKLVQKDDEFNTLSVDMPTLDAVKFYDNCGFVKRSEEGAKGMAMSGDKLNNIVNKNEAKTESIIRIV